jgi:hypothetical protein
MANPELFTGVVITSNSGSHAITVIRESYGGCKSPDMGYMMQGILVSSVMCSYLGFKESVLPQPGTRVLCVMDQGSSCFILGMLPPEALDDTPGWFGRTILGGKDALDDDANRKGHAEHTPRVFEARRPSDVVDGEYVVSNEFGILTGLYQTLAVLKASEVSQVQCFLLDDLVRIISHNFSHYTCMGDYNVWHDGKKLMAEFGATHKGPEGYGSPCVNSDQGSGKTFSEDGPNDTKDSSDYYKIEEDERRKAVERFKLFLGSVGDFLHLFVVRPDPNNKPKLNQQDPDKPDTGLCDIHIGTDGGLHIRSVKEIFIEKTQWIRVPYRKSAPEDPNGDDGMSLEYEEKKKFNFKDDYKWKSNPFAYALQIRDYVAYINEKCGYQNFKKHKKDFFVCDQIDKENKISEFGKIDKDTKLFLEKYQLRTAGIYIMPNGGITIRDAWNSAIVMEGGNIYLQATKDINLQPLRSLIGKVGQNLSLACQKEMDLSSTKGGFRLKTERAQYLYSDKGGIVLETQGKTDKVIKPYDNSQTAKELGGIVLKSKLGIYNYAEKDIVNYAKRKILLQSLDNTDIVADKKLLTYGKESNVAYSDHTVILYGDQNVDIVSDNQVIFAGANSTILGQKDQNLAVMYDEDSMFVDVLKGVVPVSEITDELKKEKKFKQKVLEQCTYNEEEAFTEKLKFWWLKSKDYGSLKPKEDAIMSTLTQQDEKLTGNWSLTKWEEVKINDTFPYPGDDLFENFLLDGDKPKNLEKNSLGKDYSNKAESKPTPPTITLKSLKSEYKVAKP